MRDMLEEHVADRSTSRRSYEVPRTVSDVEQRLQQLELPNSRGAQLNVDPTNEACSRLRATHSMTTSVVHTSGATYFGHDLLATTYFGHGQFLTYVRVRTRVGGPKGGGPEISRFFFLSRRHSFLPSLGVFSWNSGV